jgi:two-component system NtrC family sensor kinase
MTRTPMRSCRSKSPSSKFGTRKNHRGGFLPLLHLHFLITKTINQVIINLVMNAADAIDGKGTLTLRTYRDKPAKKIFLEVSDTGCGIPEENLYKIFDPFFTTKQIGKSTGLGLSIAYGIVQEHGGNISVMETGPLGTTFLIELPQYIPSMEMIA